VAQVMECFVHVVCNAWILNFVPIPSGPIHLLGGTEYLLDMYSGAVSSYYYANNPAFTSIPGWTYHITMRYSNGVGVGTFPTSFSQDIHTESRICQFCLFVFYPKPQTPNPKPQTPNPKPLNIKLFLNSFNYQINKWVN
jgi:hypothetical protein